MEPECPLCNGIMQITGRCPRCGHRLADKGRIEDFFGPYAPYSEHDLGETETAGGLAECMHLLACPLCGYDERTVIPKNTGANPVPNL